MTPARGDRLGVVVAAGLVLLGMRAARTEAALTFDRVPPVYRSDERPMLQQATRAGPLVVQDWRGHERLRIPLSSNGSDVALPALPAGYYEITSGAGDEAPRRAFAVLEPAGGPSRTFGVMTHFAQGWDPGLIPSIASAGIGTVRDEQYWKQVEPQPGHYASPASYARYMAALDEADIEPLLVLSFGNPHYDDGKTPHSPGGRAAFAAYGAELLRRHAGQVTAVDVWNEINGTFCTGPCRQDRAGTYAALLADSYAALKAVNPAVTVVGGAAVKVPLPWFDALIARGAAQHWDAVAVHPYRTDAEGAARDITALRQRLDAAGSEVPIWATEFGTGAGRADAVARRATASYLTRMAVVLRAAGVERMYWYLLRDYAEFAGMGLLRSDRDPLGRYAPTPAYAAYATLIRELDGADRVAREPTDPRTHVYRFQRGSVATYVMWAPDGPVPATVDLPQGGVLTDLVGTPRSLPAGTHTLTLDRDPQYMRGALRRMEAARPDTLLADARADFSTAASGTHWQYAAYPMPRPAAGTVCRRPDAAPHDLGVRSNAWETFYGDPLWPTLRVAVDDMHPASRQGAAVWAARRYRVDADGALRIRGAFTRRGKGDGAGACILLDGMPMFETLLPPGGQQEAKFDLLLQARAGAWIDFVATPGAALDINDDAVGLDARLSRPSAGD